MPRLQHTTSPVVVDGKPCLMLRFLADDDEILCMAGVDPASAAVVVKILAMPSWRQTDFGLHLRSQLAMSRARGTLNAHTVIHVSPHGIDATAISAHLAQFLVHCLFRADFAFQELVKSKLEEFIRGNLEISSISNGNPG